MRIALTAAACALVLSGAASAAVPVGLQNGGFEASPDFDGWTAQLLQDADYGATPSPQPATCAPPRGACVVGSDTFTPLVGEYTPMAGAPITVSPLEGNRMARLGGPFTSADQAQVLERYVLSQTFVVDPVNPVLRLNYNVFTYDSDGYDKLRLNVRLTDEDGGLITAVSQGAFGAPGNLTLKNTGWRSANIDLTGYANQQVRLSVDSGGTRDTDYGFWSYIDAGQAPVSPVSPATPVAPTNPVSGQPVKLNTFGDDVGNQSYIAIPASQAAQFPNGCMPLTLNVPIDGAGATVSDVSLLVGPNTSGGQQTFTMTDPEPDGTWTGTVACAKTADLLVQYTLTDDGEDQTYIVPIGGLTLIDPAGIVYDKAQFDAAVASGVTETQARTSAAISGATVRLQRMVDYVFNNVLAGDPGISPHINPETTGANGEYQWDVAAGSYRVVVSKDGYEVATSEQIDVPPPRTDVHIALVRTPTSTPAPADGDADGVPDITDKCPNQVAATADGCPAVTPVGGEPTGRGPATVAKPTGVASRGARAVTVTDATRSIRVAKSGSFTFRFRTAASIGGTVQLKSTKAVKIAGARKKITLGARRFTSSASGAVQVKVKLSSTQLRALKQSKRLRFAGAVKIGGQTFDIAVTLTAPRTG